MSWRYPRLALVEEIRVCRLCGTEEVRVKSFRDETLDWCEACQSFEPGTELVTEEELERRQNDAGLRSLDFYDSTRKAKRGQFKGLTFNEFMAKVERGEIKGQPHPDD